MIAKRPFVFVLVLLGFFAGPAAKLTAQEDTTNFRVTVDMVQLEVAVMDDKGNYVTGLHPSDFEVIEDGKPQKIATFGEGNQPARRVTDIANENTGTSDPQPPADVSQATYTDNAPKQLGDLIAGANVFILFDTSNYMYRGFVFAQDAIAEFVRSLDTPDRIAFYS
jgi:Ca-activated chloride channel family protein